MSIKVADNRVNKEGLHLKLTGDKINLTVRPINTSSTASSRCALLGASFSRPLSAVPLLDFYRHKEEYPLPSRITRPFSAEIVQTKAQTEKHQSNFKAITFHSEESTSTSLESIEDINKDLASSQIFNHLLKEPLNSWREGVQVKANKRHKRNDSLSDDSKESYLPSDVSYSTDTFDAKVKRMIEDSKPKGITPQLDNPTENSERSTNGNGLHQQRADGGSSQEIPNSGDTFHCGSYSNLLEIPAEGYEQSSIDEVKRNAAIEEVTRGVVSEEIHPERIEQIYPTRLEETHSGGTERTGETVKNSSVSDTNDANTNGVTNVTSSCTLTPGLKSKPPLPKRIHDLKPQVSKIVIGNDEVEHGHFSLELLNGFLEGVDEGFTIDRDFANFAPNNSDTTITEVLKHCESKFSNSMGICNSVSSDENQIIPDKLENTLTLNNQHGNFPIVEYNPHNQTSTDCYSKDKAKSGNPVINVKPDADQTSSRIDSGSSERNENFIELKVQNWIQKELDEPFANAITVNEIQTNLSLQNLRQQHKTVETYLNGRTSENKDEKAGKEKKKFRRKRSVKGIEISLDQETSEEDTGRSCSVKQGNRKREVRTRDLDRIYAGGDGVINSCPKDVTEDASHKKHCAVAKKRNNFAHPEAKANKPKPVQTNTRESKSKHCNELNSVNKNARTHSKGSNSRIQKREQFSKYPDVESWMSTKEAKTKDEGEKEPFKISNFTDLIDNLDDLDLTAANVFNVTGNTSEVTNDDPCEEIMSILRVLEDEDKKSHESMQSIKGIVRNELPRAHLQGNSGRKVEGNGSKKFNNARSERNTPSPPNGCPESHFVGVDAIKNSEDTSLHAGKSLVNLSEIMSYLDEVDKKYSESLNCAKERVEATTKLMDTTLQLDTVPRVEELKLLTSSELAHQVVDLHLRLKDKSSSITMLQKELSALREQITRMTKQSDEIIKQKLKGQKEEFEVVVKRHQKFIDQLIADKKTLNQQCESLIHEMKVLEERYTSNIKAAEHRHKVELQKMKDMHAAGEKMRREKWIDNKTQKIKELTVKGLEPELEKMTARHQKELSDLRALHKNEIEDLELRHSRKMQQQMEALREQLTEAREKAIIHEREVMRQRYEHLVETEEKNYQEQRRKLLAEHAKRLAECEERENAAYAERDKAIRQAQMDFEEKLQAAVRRHNNEVSVLKEKMEVDMEAFKNNYKKQQDMILIEKEIGIKEKCRRERDKEIETVIERLERESSDANAQVEQAAENRLRRMREKYENEIRELEASEKEAKSKYSEAKTKLLEAEDVAITLKASIKQLETQLQEAKEFSEKLLNERSKMKEIIREEMRAQTDKLEKELQRLQNDKEKELQQVYSRVKIAVARKDEILQELSRDHVALQEKCAYLENMLEQQRKEYLIK